ncbi:hypothetical protein F183_A14220 [Bryobacterales bacterium F-183]|nr:hypothetical protein F183_A14220 [Bryobacterales bacterium F-183]
MKTTSHLTLGFAFFATVSLNAQITPGAGLQVPPRINTAAVSYIADRPDRITLYGEQFGSTAGRVEIGLTGGMVGLTTISWTDRTIVATWVGGGTLPGTYLVRVLTTTGATATLDVAIGAQGPKGEPGAPGLKGESGLLAIAGKSCPAGAFLTGFTANGDLVCSSSTSTPLCQAVGARNIPMVDSTTVNSLHNWPGGTMFFYFGPGCEVTVSIPSGNISNLSGDSWGIAGKGNFSSCTITAQVPKCGSVGATARVLSNGRPYCSSSAASIFDKDSYASAILSCTP